MECPLKKTVQVYRGAVSGMVTATEISFGTCTKENCGFWEKTSSSCKAKG